MGLFKKFKKYKNSEAILYNDTSISYKDILYQITKFKKIINKKSLLLLVSSNTILSIIFYVFSIKHNCKIIILDKNHSNRFIKDTIKKFKPNFIFYPNQKKIINSGKKISFDGYTLIKLKSLINNHINDENAILLTTSGTTANPKFVRISKKNIFENTYQIQKYLKINQKQKTITTLSMAYSYGLSIINTHLEFGAKIYLNEVSPVNVKFWQIVKNQKITNFSTVPQICDFLKRIKFEKFLTKNIKYIAVAGGRTNYETLRYIKNVCKYNKINFFVMYGQTEASPRMSYIDVTKNNKIKSIGKPLVGGKMKIINNEIVYFGKNVSLGYAKDIRDLYLGDINKGKLYTGDYGKKDNEGFFYITGRKKRISKLFGLRINLDDIELSLNKRGYKVFLNINDEKIDIIYDRKYDERPIKNFIRKKYNINENYISCTQKITKNIFK